MREIIKNMSAECEVVMILNCKTDLNVENNLLSNNSEIE